MEKLLRSSVDIDGFLRRGLTKACLNEDGKIPSGREIEKAKIVNLSSFKRRVGIELI